MQTSMDGVIGNLEALPGGLPREQLILVAEDNAFNQMVILRQLEICGFRADIVANGRLAFECWESGNYALLLCDLHMPEMDGYELAKAIRASEQEQDLRHLPIVAWTASDITGEADRWRTVGMDDYLTKPTQLTVLKAKLARWLPDPAALATESSAEFTAQSLPVDINVLKTLIGDDEAIIRRFVQVFPIDAAKTAVEMRSAYAVGQMATISELAHGLKSSALMVGALELGELCAEMEVAGMAGDKTTLSALLCGFERELARVEDYLEGYYERAWGGAPGTATN